MKLIKLIEDLKEKGVEIPPEVEREIMPETQRSLLAQLVDYVKSITDVEYSELVENPESDLLILIEYSCSYLRIEGHEVRSKTYRESAHLADLFLILDKLENKYLLKFIVESTKTNQFKSSRSRKSAGVEPKENNEEFPDF